MTSRERLLDTAQRARRSATRPCCCATISWLSRSATSSRRWWPSRPPPAPPYPAGRQPGARQRLPAPGGAGQGGSNAGSAVGGPLRAGHRGRLVAGGYQRAGMPFGQGVRVGRLQGPSRCSRGCWPGRPDLQGRALHGGRHRRLPRPGAAAAPPILVGAGSRRMLGIAGREADIVGILPRRCRRGRSRGAVELVTPARRPQGGMGSTGGRGASPGRVEHGPVGGRRRRPPPGGRTPGGPAGL